MAASDLTAERLRGLINYDPDTGTLTRAVATQRTPAGAVIGDKRPDGYIRVCVDRDAHQAHRIAWLWMCGEWPSGEIDHIDGDRANNRWSNLRCVSRSVNQQNERKARAGNLSGRLGVTLIRRTGRFFASIRVNGRIMGLGLFDNADDAHAAYLAAKRKLHPGCTI